MYCFIILLHLISSFLHTGFSFIPYTYVSIKSLDSISLSSLGLKAILLISSVRVLCFSLFNFSCAFNINLLLFMKFFWSSWRLSTLILFFSVRFILFSIRATSKQFLQSSNLRFGFITLFFLPSVFFLSSSLLSLSNYIFLPLI